MIRAAVLRALVLTAAFAAALTPVTCLGQDGKPDGKQDGKQLPAEETKKPVPKLPAKATKKLPPELLALLQQKKMPLHSPILVRVFKEEAELEVWKQDATGRFQILKIYPICRWSGDLGPKLWEGDGQTPEGFYRVTPALMNPNSSYHLAMNIGYPNSFDRANRRDGSLIMIHGDCRSVGCFAMTDEQISEVYSLARESFQGGRTSFQVQSYPFRMTPSNLARHRNNPNLAFWQKLKIGNDHFEATHLEPKADVCDRTYVFDAQRPPNSRKPFALNPTGPCPAFVADPKIAQAALEKQRADEMEYARLLEDNAAAAPIYSELDGGMNRAFIERFGDKVTLSRRIGLDLAQHPVELLMGEHRRVLAPDFGALGIAEPVVRRPLHLVGGNAARWCDGRLPC
jgi:murein L,D-transpeptidase YafK